jgi:hypothetical protein
MSDIQALTLAFFARLNPYCDPKGEYQWLELLLHSWHVLPPPRPSLFVLFFDTGTVPWQGPIRSQLRIEPSFSHHARKQFFGNDQTTGSPSLFMKDR